MKSNKRELPKAGKIIIGDKSSGLGRNEEFLKNLKVLLDDTGKLSRTEWADYLFVSTSAISQWVKGKTIPSPEHLGKIILYNERFSDKKTKMAVAQFHSIADNPLIEMVSNNQLSKFKGFNRVSDFLAQSYSYIFNTEFSRIPSIIRRDVIVLFTTYLRAIKKQINNGSSVEDLYKMKYLIQSFSEREISEILFEKSNKIDWIHSEESLLEIEKTKFSCKNVWIVTPDPIEDTADKWASVIRENSMKGLAYTYILPKDKDFYNAFRQLGKIFGKSINNCSIAMLEPSVISELPSNNIVIYDPKAQNEDRECFSKIQIEERSAWYENSPEKARELVYKLSDTANASIPLNIILNDN